MLNNNELIHNLPRMIKMFMDLLALSLILSLYNTACKKNSEQILYMYLKNKATFLSVLFHFISMGNPAAFDEWQFKVYFRSILIRNKTKITDKICKVK